tara:strand:- start:5393 stop:5521 length:129 start_codon:yes stop_codon:yes gene_type:complete
MFQKGHRLLGRAEKSEVEWRKSGIFGIALFADAYALLHDKGR